MTTEQWDHVNFDTIPNPEMRKGLKRYLDTGQLPGRFLQALLYNSLTGFYAQADEVNVKLAHEWAQWMHWEFPGSAWGSAEKVAAFSKKAKVPA